MQTSLSEEVNGLTYRVIGCLNEVHSRLGPGLLESSYEACLAYELKLAGIAFERQKPIRVVYRGVDMDVGYRLDILVEGILVLELKSVKVLAPVHKAQMITYLRLSGNRIGLLVNFNVRRMKEGICRLVV
ncbi:GxxExxY protein [Pontibacter sp. G13]|uniref:GxxExxY protein n=1 Tax=Pontibacter sp. G13 TaxID=3074898 RepID=UPI0028891C39|nr:GxxExxY protein [Pontibacter sp. G13]WNJ20532.1 GxxExxY protein [Pontibacter sp. G13]